MLKNYRKLLDERKTELKIHKQTEQEGIRKLSKLENEYDILQKSREVFQKAATLTQNHLATHLSTIVTKALQTVFYEKDVHFKVEFVERRNVSECDMWIEENGHRYSLLESRGFGMTDIVSFALRVAYILLHHSDNVLIIDEPCRNLSRDKHEGTSEMIKELSKELEIQFIICTHSEDMIAYADRAFYVKQNAGVSNIIK